MKGMVIDFSMQSDRGIISGDDGNRYNFSSSSWKDTQTLPKRGLRVDFEIENKQAVEIYPVLEETHHSSSFSQKRTLSIGNIKLKQEQVLGIVAFIGCVIGGLAISSFVFAISAYREAKKVNIFADLAREINLSREQEGKNALGSIIRAQQTYHFEEGTFLSVPSASLKEDLNRLGVTISSTNYDATITKADRQEAVVIVEANNEGLKSYAGRITYSSADLKYIAVFCETNNPAKEISLPIFDGDNYQCASGSKPIE